MNKLFLTMTLAFCTMIASAQFSVLTTVTEGSDSTWNITDKLGVGYQMGEKLMIGLTMDGEDKYELLGRYDIREGLWATCVYNYEADSEEKLMDKMDLGLGYSFKVWNSLYVEPNYTIALKKNKADEREGTLNVGVSYKF